MEYVVIKGAAGQGGTITCSHEGTVPIPAGNPLLTINGVEVVVSGMEIGINISTCPSPCTSTNTTISGISTKLRVAGQGVLLSNATGTAVNANDPSATWEVSDPGQSIFTEG